MTTAASPLLHIGFQKTGSSWLQAKVFGSPAVGFGTLGGERRVKRNLIALHDLEFDPAACREAYDELIEAVTASGLVPVLSSERLSGDMLFGAYDSAQLADRLRRSFPEARVLIVIREQRSMLFSTYHQYVKLGGLLTLPDYLHRPEKQHPWPCNLRHYEYDRLLAHYHERFGRDSVLTLPYELFRSDPGAFVRRIVEFAGAQPEEGAVDGLRFEKVVNQAWPATATAAKRHLNRVVRERLNPWVRVDGRGAAGQRATKAVRSLGRIVPDELDARIERRMRATIAEKVGDRFQASNTRTAALTGFDLGRYGYDVGAPATREANSSTASRSPARTRT